jgi:hypothetical protein
MGRSEKNLHETTKVRGVEKGGSHRHPKPITSMTTPKLTPNHPLSDDGDTLSMTFSVKVAAKQRPKYGPNLLNGQMNQRWMTKKPYSWPAPALHRLVTTTLCESVTRS